MKDISFISLLAILTISCALAETNDASNNAISQGSIIYDDQINCKNYSFMNIVVVKNGTISSTGKLAVTLPKKDEKYAIVTLTCSQKSGADDLREQIDVVKLGRINIGVNGFLGVSENDELILVVKEDNGLKIFQDRNGNTNLFKYKFNAKKMMNSGKIKLIDGEIMSDGRIKILKK